MAARFLCLYANSVPNSHDRLAGDRDHSYLCQPATRQVPGSVANLADIPATGLLRATQYAHQHTGHLDHL